MSRRQLSLGALTVLEVAPALETGARLGATQALVGACDPDPKRLAERFAALCDLGAQLGLSINIEPMPWTEVKNVAQGLRLLGAARCHNAGLLIASVRKPKRCWRRFKRALAPATDAQAEVL